MIPKTAKAYIAAIAATAIAVLVIVALRWSPEHIGYFGLFYGLAMVASALKVRLPGLKGNISINFVFILVSLALFSFGETVLIALGGGLVQSLWRPQQPVKPPQVLFNASCLTVSAASAFWAPHAILEMLHLNSLSALMSTGASVYVLLNTGLVSLVISLAEKRSLKQVWLQCYEWTFPYFLVGAAVAGLASAAGHETNFGLILAIVPTMYLVYLYYRMRIVRVVLEGIVHANREHDGELVGASQAH